MLETMRDDDTEMTFMEITADQIHNYLEHVINYQTRYRLVSFIL